MPGSAPRDGVLPLALVRIGGVDTDGNAGQGVAISVRKFPRHHAGHRGTRRVSAVFVDCRQAERTGHWPVGQRVHGDRDVAAGGLRSATGVTQVIGQHRDGVGAGAGGVGVVGVWRVLEIGRAQRCVDGKEGAGDGHAMAVIGGDSAQTGRADKPEIAVGSAQCRLHHAGTSVGVRQGNTRHRERAVFVQALRHGHRQYRCCIDGCHRDGGGAGVANLAGRIQRGEIKVPVAAEVCHRYIGHVDAVGQRNDGTDTQNGTGTVLQNTAFRQALDAVAGERSVSCVVGTPVHVCSAQRERQCGVLVHIEGSVGGARYVVHCIDGACHQYCRQRVCGRAAVAGVGAEV